MTDDDLAVLKASIDQRVELICVDGETILGEVVMVSADDVLLDFVRQPDNTDSGAFVLSVSFSEIASVQRVERQGTCERGAT